MDNNYYHDLIEQISLLEGLDDPSYEDMEKLEMLKCELEDIEYEFK